MLLVYNSMNPTIVMNEPYIAEELPSLDKQMVLNNNALTMYIDRNTLQQFIVIDGTSFTRHNGLTTRTISWETFHDRMERIRALVAPPDNNTLTANHTIQITSGAGRTAEFFMNGTATEINSTGAVSITPTSSLTTTSATDTTINAGQIINLITGSQLITCNGATMDMGTGNVINVNTLGGINNAPLFIEGNGVGGNINFTTRISNRTTMDTEGDLSIIHLGGTSQATGGIKVNGIRGLPILTTGGGTGQGDLISKNFLGGLNDGRSHNLTGGVGNNIPFRQFGLDFPESFGMRWVFTIGDTNQFISFMFQGVDIGGTQQPVQDIRYIRETFQGVPGVAQVVKWVDEGGAGIQVPAVQENRFKRGSSAILEITCNYLWDSQVAGTRQGLSWTANISGQESNGEKVVAEVKGSFIDNPFPQPDHFDFNLVSETAGGIRSVEVCELFTRGSPFGM